MREVQYLCKICGEQFSYSHESLMLRMKSGESQPERCENCREEHEAGVKDISLSYLYIPISTARTSAFMESNGAKRFAASRERGFIPHPPDFKGMQVAITDEDILELYKKLEQNQVVVVVGETGSGKSTTIPGRLLVPPPSYQGDFTERLLRQGQLVITEPTRASIIQIPQTVSRVVGSRVGPDQAIGFRHGDPLGAGRGEEWSRFNLAVFATDGSLLNWITDGSIGFYSLIIVDEAHMRSINIDIILGHLKIALRKYPHLKLIISSATINPETFVKSFMEFGLQVELFRIPDRKKEKHYLHYWQAEGAETAGCRCWLCGMKEAERSAFWEALPEEVTERNLPEAAAGLAAEILKRTKKGNLLIFLHGQREVEETIRLLKKETSEAEIQVFGLYKILLDRLGRAEFERQLEKLGSSRCVIVATNIIETGVTLPEMVYEIESGFIKEVEYDSEAGQSRLQPRRHSKSGITQRYGRVGRTQDGFIYTLYTKEEFNEFPEETTPEIQRECLDESLIKIKAGGISETGVFPWVSNPREEELKRSTQVIRNSEVLDSAGDVTDRGLELMHLPREPREANLIIRSDALGCLLEAVSVIVTASTREGIPRLGESLYDRELGFFDWNPRWSAWRKSETYRVHQSFRALCQDEVALAAKLIWFIAEAEKTGNGAEWTNSIRLNYENLLGILDAREELLEAFEQDAEEAERKRELKFSELKLVRGLLRTGLAKNLGIAPASEEVPDEENTFLLDMDFPVDWSEVKDYFKSQVGKSLELTIEAVRRDPVGRGGWIEARTKEGISVPLELFALSLSPLGYGLEQLAGKTLSLEVSGLDAHGWPIVSNLKNIIADLKVFREEMAKAEDQEIIVSGHIVYVDAEEGEVVVATAPTPQGVVHCFFADKNALPIPDFNILKIGEAVGITLRPTKREECLTKLEPAEEEGKTLRQLKLKDFSYEDGILFHPFCLEEKRLTRLDLAPATLEVILRQSWRHYFYAKRVALTERLGSHKSGEVVSGTIVAENRDRATGELKSFQVVLEGGAPGFVFAGDLISVTGVIGKKLRFYIRDINPEFGFLRLVECEKEDERRRARAEWLQRIKANIARWQDNISKAHDRIRRIQLNITKNQQLLAAARSLKWQTIYASWIKDGEQQIEKEKRFVSDWEAKIADAMRRLKESEDRF